LVPFTVGGGIRTLEDARKVLSNGAEKVCLNTAAFENPSVITEIANNFGSQSVVVSLDVKKSLLGKYDLYSRCGTTKRKESLMDAAKMIADAGAGEIIINAIDRDGIRKGYDTNLLKLISDEVTLPVIAMGGAGSNEHFEMAIHDGGVEAVSAGSFFVFHGRREAVLISYLNDEDHKRITMSR
jgi:cyclase